MQTPIIPSTPLHSIHSGKTLHKGIISWALDSSPGWVVGGWEWFGWVGIGLSGWLGIGDKLRRVKDCLEIELGRFGLDQALGDLGRPFGITATAPFGGTVFPVNMSVDGFPGFAAFGEEWERPAVGGCGAVFVTADADAVGGFD
jgi:hypothetical protein